MGERIMKTLLLLLLLASCAHEFGEGAKIIEVPNDETPQEPITVEPRPGFR
jgi:hypothetical protein